MAKESTAHRRARVKFQLRDKKGRWIEMGRGVKWYSPKLKRNVSGTVVGVTGRNAVVNLTSEPKGVDGKPQQITVKGSDIEVISSKATLGGRAGKMAKVAAKTAKKAELVGGREDKGGTITAEKPTSDPINNLIKSSEEALEKAEKAEKPKAEAKPKAGNAKAKPNAKKGSQADSDKEDDETPEVDEPDVAELEDIDIDDDLDEDEDTDADEDVDTSPTDIDSLEATVEELEAVVEEVASGDLDAAEIEAKLEEEVYSVYGNDGKQYDLDVKKDLEGKWNYRLRDAEGKARKIHAMVPADENDSVDAGAKLHAAMNPKTKAKATTAKPEEKAPEADVIKKTDDMLKEADEAQRNRAPAAAPSDGADDERRIQEHKEAVEAVKKRFPNGLELPAKDSKASKSDTPELDLKGLTGIRKNDEGQYLATDVTPELLERVPVGTAIVADRDGADGRSYLKIAPNRWAQKNSLTGHDTRELPDSAMMGPTGEGEEDEIVLPGHEDHPFEDGDVAKYTEQLERADARKKQDTADLEARVKAREEAKPKPKVEAPKDTTPVPEGEQKGLFAEPKKTNRKSITATRKEFEDLPEGTKIHFADAMGENPESYQKFVEYDGKQVWAKMEDADEEIDPDHYTEKSESQEARELLTNAEMGKAQRDRPYDKEIPDRLSEKFKADAREEVNNKRLNEPVKHDLPLIKGDNKAGPDPDATPESEDEEEEPLDDEDFETDDEIWLDAQETNRWNTKYNFNREQKEAYEDAIRAAEAEAGPEAYKDRPKWAETIKRHFDAAAEAKASEDAPESEVTSIKATKDGNKVKLEGYELTTVRDLEAGDSYIPISEVDGKGQHAKYVTMDAADRVTGTTNKHNSKEIAVDANATPVNVVTKTSEATYADIRQSGGQAYSQSKQNHGRGTWQTGNAQARTALNRNTMVLKNTPEVREALAKAGMNVSAPAKDMSRDELINEAGDLEGLKHEADITGMGDRQFTPKHQSRLDALNKELKTRGDEPAPQAEEQKADTTPETAPEAPQDAPEAVDTPEEQEADVAPENPAEAADAWTPAPAPAPAAAAVAQTDEEADAAIAALMAEQGIERTEPVTMEGEKYPPTRQQQDVIDAVMAGKDTKVQAMAGTGKTSTLEALSRRLEVQGKDAVYIAFNKTVQLEAAERMPKNVEARTGHSLANAWAREAMPFLGLRMANKDPLKTFVNPETKQTENMPKVPVTASGKIAGVLGINEKSVTVEGGQGLGKSRSVQAVKRMVNSYALSDSDEVGPEHIPAEFSADDAEFVLSEEGKTALVGFAKAYWDDLSREDGVFRVAHDTYRKHWALSRPDLTDGSGGNKGADVLYIDEAQDTPAVLAKVVADQNMQKVIVGDANQAIYEFAENIDYLSQADSDIELPLNKSWRFGPVVADAGNRFLELLEAPNRVVGGGGESKRVVGMEDADAVLVRTNAGMVDAVLEEAENDRRVSAPDGTRANLKSLATSVQSLMDGERPENPHDDLVGYKNWDEVLTAFYQKDPSVQTLTKLFDVTDAKQLSKMTPDQHQAARENAMARVNKAIDAIVEPVDGFSTIQKTVEGKRTYLEVADGFEGTTNQRNFAVLNFAANLGRQRDPYAANASDKWVNQQKAYRDVGLGVLKADGWRFDGNSKRWYSENADTIAKFDAFEGKYDVMVSTAHKSKGLEWDRVRIGYDFPAPRQDENTGATVMPEDAEYKLAYVAATRAKKELDMGGLDYVYEMTSENGGLPKARKGDSDEADAARVEDGAVTPEAVPEPEDNTDVSASEAEATRYDDAAPAEVVDSAAPEAPQAPEADEVADESVPEAAPEAPEASPEPEAAPEPTPAPAATPEPVEAPEEAPSNGPEGEAPPEPEPTAEGQEGIAREIGENFVPGDTDETQAAMLYMAGAEYNNVLRQGNTENGALNTRIESLTGFIEKQKPLPTGTKVYRGGAKGVGEYKVGEEFSDPAFLSTSLNRDQSDLMSGGGALMEIDANGLKGLSITSVLEHESYKDVPDDIRPALNPLNREGEILMPPGTKLRIDAIDTDENGRTIVRASAAPTTSDEASETSTEGSEAPDDAAPVDGLDEDGLTPDEAAYVAKLNKAIADGYRTGMGNVQALGERLDEMYERGAARQRGEDPDVAPEAAPEVKPAEDKEPATPEAEEEVVPEAEEVVEEAPEPTPEAPVETETEPVEVVETEEGPQGDASDGEEASEAAPTDLESYEATASALFETFQDAQKTPRTPAELQDVLDEEVYLLLGEDGADYEFGLTVDDKGAWNYILSDDDGNELERYNVVTTSPEEAGQKAFERVNGSQESETTEEAPAEEVTTAPVAEEEPVADADRVELDPTEAVDDPEVLPDPEPLPEVEEETSEEVETETSAEQGGDVSETATADTTPASSVVGKSNNYPDGTQIKDSRTGETIEKTGGKWHVAGKPNRAADPSAMDTPIVSEMPKLPAESFQPFEGMESVAAGDIIVTKKGEQASVIGTRSGKLVVVPHNVPDAEKAVRPNIVFADPAAVTGISKFDASASAEAGPVVEPAAKPARAGSNRGRTDVAVEDSTGVETKIGDRVITAIGQGVVVGTRPSSGPKGAVKVRFDNGDEKFIRSNKFTNAASIEEIEPDDPATMEIGAQGTSADGRKFLVGKGNKPIHKGDRVELPDGRTATVSGIYAGAKSAGLTLEDGSTTRKKVSTLDCLEYGMDTPETLETKNGVGLTGKVNLSNAINRARNEVALLNMTSEEKKEFENRMKNKAAELGSVKDDGSDRKDAEAMFDKWVFDAIAELKRKNDPLVASGTPENPSPLFFTVDDKGNVLELIKDEDDTLAIRLDGEWVDISDEDEFPTVYEQTLKPATDDSVGAWDADLEDNNELKLEDIAEYIAE